MDESLFNRHERELAEILPGVERTIASGAKLDKHDIRTLNTDSSRFWQFRYELKCTQKKSYSFKQSEWKELVEYVYRNSSDMRPAWAVRFYEDVEKARAVDVPVKADLVVVDVNDWVELLEELEELRRLRDGKSED